MRKILLLLLTILCLGEIQAQKTIYGFPLGVQTYTFRRSFPLHALKALDTIKMFGFTDDLLANDIEKIHDLLAEPLFVIDLDKQGFKPIEKMPSKIKVGGDVQTAADFIATRNSVRYAIEFKTIRTETGIEDGVPFGNSNKSNWWGEMFFNNAVMKIEDKSRRAISQLENTKAHYHCDVKMLVLHSRRLGPSTLLSDAELLSELQKLSLRYPEIDYFCGKLYYGEIAFFPELP